MHQSKKYATIIYYVVNVVWVLVSSTDKVYDGWIRDLRAIGKLRMRVLQFVLILYGLESWTLNYFLMQEYI